MALRFQPSQAWIAGTVVLADQVSKAMVRSRLAEYADSTVVIPGFFDLTRVHNTGIAYGVLNLADFPFKTAVMVLVAGVALTGLTVYAASLEPEQRLSRLGLSFVLGGAAGNLIDRIVHGYVLDFFDFYWRGWHFWAFNVADAAITTGVALMVLELLAGQRRVSRAV